MSLGFQVRMGVDLNQTSFVHPTWDIAHLPRVSDHHITVFQMQWKVDYPFDLLPCPLSFAVYSHLTFFSHTLAARGVMTLGQLVMS